jgi:hypothetical protein
MNLLQFAAQNARLEFRSPAPLLGSEREKPCSPSGGDIGPFDCCAEFGTEPNELGYTFCPVCDSVRQVKR